MLDAYIKKLNKARELVYANRSAYNEVINKGMIPWINEEAQRAYEELYCEKPYRSIHCTEVKVFHLFYDCTNHLCNNLETQYVTLKVLAKARNWVEALKQDESGVDKSEQAKNMLSAIKTLPYYWYHSSGLDKCRLGECALICTQMLYDYGDVFMELFPTDCAIKEIALQFWKEGVQRQTQWKYCNVDKKYFDENKLEGYVQKIKGFDESYIKPKTPHPLIVWWKGFE